MLDFWGCTVTAFADMETYNPPLFVYRNYERILLIVMCIISVIILAVIVIILINRKTK